MSADISAQEPSTGSPPREQDELCVQAMHSTNAMNRSQTDSSVCKDAVCAGFKQGIAQGTVLSPSAHLSKVAGLGQ